MDRSRPRSRPKNLDEVSAQDNTVQVLKKTLESANVSRSRSSESHQSRWLMCWSGAASPHAILRTPGNRKGEPHAFGFDSVCSLLIVLSSCRRPRPSSRCASSYSGLSCTSRVCSSSTRPTSAGSTSSGRRSKTSPKPQSQLTTTREYLPTRPGQDGLGRWTSGELRKR
jgi:hypothetical protein